MQADLPAMFGPVISMKRLLSTIDGRVIGDKFFLPDILIQHRMSSSDDV